MVNPSLEIKMITTGLLSITAIVLFLLDSKSKPRLLCMIAMILCSFGDVFMTNIFKINGIITVAVGASLFMAGHLFYASMNKQLIVDHKGDIKNIGLYIGLGVALLPEAVMIILAYTVAPIKPDLLYVIAVPVYVVVIGIHIGTNYAYGMTIKNWRGLVLGLSVTLFYVTDIWIFMNMYNLGNIESAIWHFYPLAQLCIILFSAPLNTKKTK